MAYWRDPPHYPTLNAKKRIILIGDSHVQRGARSDTVVSLTTAGVLTTTANLADGAKIAITGASDEIYNGLFTVTKTGQATGTITLPSTPASNAAARSGSSLNSIPQASVGGGCVFTWLNATNGGGFDVVCNGGGSGYKASDLPNQFSKFVVPSLPAEWVYLSTGYNDVTALGNSINAAGCDTAYTYIANFVTACLRSGLQVMLATQITIAAGNANKNSNMCYLNQRIRDLCRSTPGVYLIDVFAASVDGTSSTFAYATNVTSEDAQHLTVKGCYYVAKNLNSTFAKLVANLPTENHLVSSAADDVAVSTSSKQFMGDPCFSVGTAGSKTGGTQIGNVSSGWDCYTNGSTINHTISTRTDQMGKTQDMAITLLTDGNIIQLRKSGDIGTGNVVAGDTVYMSCEINIGGSMTNINGITIEAGFVTQGDGFDGYYFFPSVSTADSTSGAAASWINSVSDTFVFRTGRFIMPAVVSGLTITPHVQIKSQSGNGSGTVKVGRFGIFKV